MARYKGKDNTGHRFFHTTCALVLAMTLACANAGTCAQNAWADVRKTDVIAGSTIEQRGISAVRCPSVDAEHVFVVDENGNAYFERDADAQVHIASITKVMTAIVALETAPLDTVVTVTADAAAVGESSASLQEGDTLDLLTALNGLLVSSGNDAAIAIADTLGASLKTSDAQTNREAFVAKMNAKAAELGMADTLFANPHGLDADGHEADMHSSASDVSVMCRYAMQNETFRQIVAKDAAVLDVIRADGTPASINLASTDELLGVYEGACGIKTGFTELAGASFAGASVRDGAYLYAIVLNSTSEAQRFVDAQTLFDWVYDNQVAYPLAHSSETVTTSYTGTTLEVPVVAEVAQTCWVDRTVKATLADPTASVTVFAPNGNISQSFDFDEPDGEVHAGDKLGTVTFYQRNSVVATADLIACEDSSAPGVFESVGIWWDHLWRGFSGELQQATSRIVNDTPLIYDKQSAVA